jgi:hypothetical protein
MGTGSLSLGVSGWGVVHPHRLRPKLKKEYISQSNPSLGIHACSRVIFTRFMEFAFTPSFTDTNLKYQFSYPNKNPTFPDLIFAKVYRNLPLESAGDLLNSKFISIRILQS